MTDIRRTLLWVVFTMSLVLLWDGWNKHTGQPSMFSASPRPAAAVSAAPAGALPASQVGVPTASATGALPVATPASGAAATPTAAAPGAAAGELTTVTTDLVRAQFDSVGGNLVRLELLQHVDSEDRKRNTLLFDRSAERVYAAQTGLITAQTGVTLPNHYTPMKRVAGPDTMAAGANELAVRFETAAPGGVTLAKTFTFKRGSYVVGVKHEVVNAGAAAVTPQLYLQLVRDGNPARGESKWYFTFTGPAVYTDAKRYEKIDFKDIEKGKTGHVTSATTAGSRWCSTTSRRPGWWPRPARASSAHRR
jgi:YidC/Oxa1 family membrane protein insertase